MPSRQRAKPAVAQLAKCLTGITGLDELTGGGLPLGRPTLVCGSAGCGKTLLAMQFLVNGALDYGEPGVFVSFEESPKELAENVASLGFDLKRMVRRKQIWLEHIQMDNSRPLETGEYNLEGLFIRLGYAITAIGAKRVVLDTLEALFAYLPNRELVRSELHRLFVWLKARGVTAVVTAERGDGALTRYGMEEYVADCVILLDHRVIEQISTRRLRVVKYRGSLHGTNEYPFLFGRRGLSVLPITSLGLDHPVETARISSGVAGLDAMLDGKGYYRGSSILISGATGTGKGSLAVSMVAAACQRGEQCLYFSFEESRDQIVRNMHSIGIDLAPHLRSGRLEFHIGRPTVFGLERHLVTMYDAVNEAKPALVVIDPITEFLSVGSLMDVRATLTRLADFLKTQGITAVLTNLTASSDAQPDLSLSSLVDASIQLLHLEAGRQRRRGLYILKARGMPHAQDVREYWLTDQGVTVAAPEGGPNAAVDSALHAAR